MPRLERRAGDETAGGRRWVWPATFAAALAVHLAVAWQPLETLVGRCVADDAFYYLTIARHIAAGHGATFDGTTVTNGFHPAYMALLTGLAAVVPRGAPELLVHLALTLLAVAGVATGVVIHKIAKATLGAPAAAAAALLWLFNPEIIRTTLQGLEAPLAALTLSIATLMLVRGRAFTDDRAGARAALLFGATLGLACLCRTDAVLFGSVLGATFVWRAHRSLGWPRAIARAVRVAAAAAVLVAPWLLWNLARLGRITQDSARAISGFRHDNWFAQHTWNELPGHVLVNVVHRARDFSAQFGYGKAGWIVLPIVLTAVAITAWRRRRTPQPFPALALALGLAATLLFYGGVFWFGQRWYYQTPFFATTLLLGWAVHELGALWAARAGAPRTRADLRREKKGAARRGFAGPIPIAAAAVAAMLAIAGPELDDDLYAWQRLYLRAGRALVQKLPPTTRLGAFNAGIYGFVLEGRAVVNLDGVVNGRAYEAIKKRALLPYLRDEARVTHLLDHGAVVSFYLPFGGPGFKEALQVRTRDKNRVGGDLILFELLPPAAQAAAR